MMSARLFELNRIGKAAGAEAQNLDGILTPSRSSPHRNHDQRGQPLLHRHSDFAKTSEGGLPGLKRRKKIFLKK